MIDHRLLNAYKDMIAAVFFNVNDEKYETAKYTLWIACKKNHKRFHRFLYSAIEVGAKRQNTHIIL